MVASSSRYFPVAQADMTFAIMVPIMENQEHAGCNSVWVYVGAIFEMPKEPAPQQVSMVLPQWILLKTVIVC